MIEKLFLSLLFLTCTSQLFAKEDNKKRIHLLLPELGSTFNIEPCIPDDYVLIHQQDGCDSYFWIPDGVFEKYIEDEKAEHRPFIQVKVLKGPSNKNLLQECISEIKKQFPAKITSLRWGEYKVASVKMFPTSDEEYIAYVKKDDECLVIFILVYHKKIDYGNGNIPSIKDLDFWNDFLNKTKSF